MFHWHKWSKYFPVQEPCNEIVQVQVCETCGLIRKSHKIAYVPHEVAVVLWKFFHKENLSMYRTVAEQFAEREENKFGVAVDNKGAKPT